jgi:hypothetical protein
MTKFRILILLAALQCSCNQLKYLDAFDGYEGKPKIVEVESYEIVDNGIQSKEELSSVDVFYFDNKGRMTNWLDFYGPEKKPGSNGWKYEYDEKGNIIKFYMIDLNNKALDPIIYEYNKNGQLVLERRKESIKKIQYDKDQRTALLTANRKDGTFLERALIKYDLKGREIESSSYDSSNNLITRYNYSYDLEKASKKTERYGSENKLISISHLYNDIQGNPIKIEAYRATGKDTILTSKTDYINKYDALNNLIEQKVFFNDKATYVEKTIIHY